MRAKATAPDWRNAPRQPKKVGLGDDANALGVHRTTLWRAISGKNANAALLSRYQDLLRLRSKTTNPDQS